MAELKVPELNVTVLGCCGSFPGAGGACSGYLVDDGTTRLWLDAGSGTLANLQRHCALESVDVLVLSHEHPDHWSDVEGWIIGLRHLAAPRGIPVFAPSGLRERTYHPSEPHLDWNVVADGDSASAGTMSMTFSRTDHPVETLAVRIETGGLALGYSSDTGPGWSLEALGPGLDLALCEATVPTTEEGKMQHLSARQAGASARAAGVERLVLTHLWPTLDLERTGADGAEAFGGPVDVASDNAVYTVAAPA